MTTMETPESESDRLRRHLRALSAVNNQLHAQLESGLRRTGSGDLLGDGGDVRLSSLAIRRAGAGSQWIEQLQLYGSVPDPFLVRHAKRGSFLVEGPIRRQVKAGMLYVALQGVVGAGRVVTDTELDRWKEGPPVEVLEAPSGAAFVVVAGRRLTLRGVPLPFPVTTEEMLRFPEGAELRIGAGGSGSSSSRAGIARARGLVRRDGVGATGTKVLKRGAAKAVRKLRGAVR
jgi:hypothetical protein